MTASRFHHLTRHILHSNRLSIGIFVAAWIFIVSVVLGGEAPKDTASTTSNYYGYGYGYGYDGGSKETGNVDTGSSIRVGCTVDNDTITQIIQLRTAYYTNMYADQNAQLAAQKIANIKDVVYQACGYDLDNPTSEALVLQREQKINGCESDYQRYNAAYIEYIKGGNISLASQLKQIIDAVDANGGCAEGDKTIGSAYFANAGDVHPVGIARSMGAAICDNTDFVFSYVQQIKGFTSTDRIDAVVANFEDLIQQADANSLLDKEELLFIVKAIAESHGEYLRGEGGGIMDVNVSAFCKSIKGDFATVQLISSLDDYKSAENMTFDGETEKRYKQISLVAGDTIYFNFLIDGNPIDETFLAYTPDEDGTYTVTFDPRSPRTISIRRIEDSVEEVVDEIIRQNIIAAYETLSTSTDASAVAQAISQAYVQGYNSRVDYGSNGGQIGANNTVFGYTTQASRDWMGAYMIANRPEGVEEYDAVDSASWGWVANLATQAVLARQADLVSRVNNATSAGTVDDYNNVGSRDGSDDGNMAKPFADYILSMSYGTYFCCSNITNTTEKKQMILDYVFAGRGAYANTTAMNTEVSAAVTYIENINIIAAYETLSTSTDASAVAQAISQAYVQGYNNRVDYGTNGGEIGANNTVFGYTTQASRDWMGAYMIANRPAGVEEYDAVDSASWGWVANLATQAVLARQADLVSRVNNATSAGTVDDYNNVGSRDGSDDGNMAKPFADYIISMSYGTYFCCSNVTNTTEKKQMILDYVFAGRGGYMSANDIMTATQGGVDGIPE